MGLVTYLLHGHLVPSAILVAKNLALFSIVLGIEIACVGWRNCSFHNLLKFNRSVRDDLFSFVVLRTRLAYFMGLGFTLAGGSFVDQAVRPWIGIDGIGSVYRVFDVPVLGIVLAVLVRSFTTYWFHRWSHHNPILWSVHKYHHIASDMTILNGERTHAFEMALLKTCEIMLFSLFTRGDFMVPFLVIMFTKLHVALTHTNITSTWGWIGRHILSSPMAHRIHHQRHHDGRSYNFSSLQLWDNLFGTTMLTADGPDPRIPVGLTEEYERGNAIQHYVLIVRDFAVAVLQALSRSGKRLVTITAAMRTPAKSSAAG